MYIDNNMSVLCNKSLYIRILVTRFRRRTSRLKMFAEVFAVNIKVPFKI